MILADSSVWIAHLRHDRADLRAFLESGLICRHEFVIGELACGALRRRSETIALLEQLPDLPAATHREVFAFLNARRLWGRGLGWIDVHLLASAVVAGARLWTLDRRLAAAATALRVGLDAG